MEHTVESAGGADDVEADPVDDDTILRQRPSTLVGGSAVGTPSAADLDDTVIGLIQPHAPARDRTVLPSAAPTEPVAPAEPERIPSVWAARIRGTDVTIPLDRPVIIGRHPSVARIEEVPHPRRVQIPARHRDVSARHVRIEQLGDTLVVTDLGSTNGIDVHLSQGSVRRLRPGETSVVLPSAVVAIGDAVVVEFQAAATP
ncbi:MAG: FHA domain-containing protein [Microcella sp.]|uniref:FHA domain-containing protein n=1 Tax=Microcella sp. TaxID=1913979 RepID=UPI003315C530